MLKEEYQKFDFYIQDQKFDDLMTHYPIREANLLNSIAKKCGFADRQRYEHNVILMLSKNDEAHKFVLSLLGGADVATVKIVSKQNL